MYSILYVDDEPGLLEIVKLFLEQDKEFSVDTDISAAKALGPIGSRSYDAIISDYQMPGMNGIAFLKAVRERYGDIPFILFTGRGREEVVIEAINNGADFYLQKGGDPRAQFAELAHKVRQAVARKRAELSRVESEKRLTDIINFLPDATFAIDRAGTVIAWNRAIEEMTGVYAAEMLGKGDYEYAIPFYGKRRKILIDLTFEPDEVIARDYAHIFHEKDVLIAETNLPRPQGNVLTLMGKASPLYNRQGKIVGAIESIRDITQRERDAEGGIIGAVETLEDITERRNMENALRESEEKYRRILENLQDAYIRTNENGIVTMVSPSAARMYGYDSVEEMIGIPAATLYGPSGTRENMLRFLQDAGGITDFTGEARRKDGTTFWVSLNVQFLRDDTGRIRGTEGIVRDISERKAMERAIEEANRKLTLLSSITRHDVANKVTVISGFAQAARMRKPERIVTDLLEKIEAAGSDIARQIAFTKNYQELGMHAPGWFSISELVALQNTAGVKLFCTCKAEIYADPMVERVIFNIIDNAIRHGGLVTDIAVSCEPGADGLVIAIEDNGTGIPADIKEKIFEHGFGKHTGFGLFLAREILAITGITIREIGTFGKGARFELTVPKGSYRD